MTDFIILGTINAITYKEVFPHIKEGSMRGGYTYGKSITFKRNGEDFKMGNSGWFTTLPVKGKRKLVLSEKYTPDKYPKYDNYDAINVNRIKDIPYDYNGVMGVPITILGYDLKNVQIIDLMQSWGAGNPYINGKKTYARICIKQNPEQFEILGLDRYVEDNPHYGHRFTIGGKETYARILIKK